MDRIICVAGPTASGKTALAIYLAKLLDGEVISCDSMQIYRGMDIGTAKPTKEEMGGIPHHMLDVADPNEPFSAGRYVQMADPLLQDILSRGKTAIVAGGTGLYMDSLMQGRDFAQKQDEDLRQSLMLRAEAEGAAALLEELRVFDPETASRLCEKDVKRIVRAIEVYRLTGKTIHAHNLETQQIPPKYQPLWLGLTYSQRQSLYDRIDLRVDKMLNEGLLEEIDRLLSAGIRPDATALQAIGYKELLRFKKGECSLADAVAEVKQGSRRYAKRQLTWFRRNECMHWLDRSLLQTEDELFLAARRHLADFDR